MAHGRQRVDTWVTAGTTHTSTGRVGAAERLETEVVSVARVCAVRGCDASSGMDRALGGNPAHKGGWR